MSIPTARLRELRASSTEAEKVAWNLLRDRRLGAKFRRQFRLEGRVLDFYCFEHRLAIELDGGVHSQIDQMRKDAAKEDYLRTLGIRLFAFRMPWFWSTRTSLCGRLSMQLRRLVTRLGSHPSPVSRPLVKARGATHPLPSERGNHIWGARARKKRFFSFSQGRRWTATGVLTSRRGPDEGSLPWLLPNKGDVRLLVGVSG